SPLFQGSQTGTTFEPGLLEWEKTCYWRIDEVGAAESWKGNVWSFTVRNFLIVDDFESYTDEEEALGKRIYQTWMDGWVNGNGATVGNWDPPFAEQTIVHGGAQSMPIDYNNIDSPWYSEAERTWEQPQNWTLNEVTDLSLWFRGNPAGFLETGPGAFSMSGGGVDIWSAADEFRFAFKRLNGDGTILARVESVLNTHAWAKVGVMIRESLDPTSTFAAVYATPGNGVRYQARLTTAVNATSDTPVVTTEQTALQAPVWVKIERSGSTFNGFYSTDGVNWTSMSWNPQTITMTGTVYIGLAVTSHNANAITAAEFSGVATTGNVTGQWQAVEIGADQLDNSPQSLYVAVVDSTNKTATMVHPDPGAVLTTAWTEWKIPLTDLTGVNLAKVKKLRIGVGDRSNAQPDGTGRVYIDDIRIIKDAPVEPNAAP
ncbi:MAG: hypothetical protein GTN75_01550, partial [Gemmatimonadetes bacterium]|nr:hypothetical protein [Gemmatimonadota bacterium]